MESQYNKIFRAHIDKNTGREQSVQDHLVSVSRIAAESARHLGLENTARLAGLLHDAGKFTQRFDTYIYNAVFDLETTRRGEVNHTSAGGKYIMEMYGNDTRIIAKITAQLIAVVISSHHGLYDCIHLEDGENVFLNRRMNPEKDIGYEEALENFFQEVVTKEEVDEFFEKSVQEVTRFFESFSDSHKFFQMALLERLLLSLVVEGDWTDTGAFAADARAESYQTPDWGQICEYYEKRISQFSSGGKINTLRKQISDDCKAAAKRPGGIQRLIVPTGGGKTLSSLRFALHHVKNWEKKRIFYIIPFLSILEQNAEVIRDFVGDGSIVFEHHSNIIQDEDESSYRDESKKALFQGWEEPIIITTLVQFLNTLFSDQLQSVRRMHSLSHSVIILDEVQSLPLKTLRIFNMAMNFLAYSCGATVVLCSATQPVFDSETIFKDTRLRLEGNSSLTTNVEESFRAFRRVELVDLTRTRAFDPESAAIFCREQVMEPAKEKLLFICNTKQQAAQIFKQLKDQEEDDISLFHLSTNMVPEHRVEVLNEIREQLENPGKLICVTTQLIEAGVDVDFFCVVRVVAGLDNAIQAAGRCNRNGRREMGFIYIIRMKDEDLSRLGEMKEAQAACRELLQNFSEDRASYDSDLFSMKSIQRFYTRYFAAFQNQDLSYYPVPKKPGVTIFDLLSKNELARDAYRGKTGKNVSQAFCQGFKTAGQAFEVIPRNTTNILVSYGEGVELIKNLNGQLSLSKMKNMLRKAQRYTISVYNTMYRQLEKEEAIYPICGGKLLALKPEFYDEKTGVVTTGGGMALLDF